MEILSVTERERLKKAGERDREPCTNKDKWKWKWQRVGAGGVHHCQALRAKLTKWWESKAVCDFLLIFSIWRKEIMDPSRLYLSARELEGKSKAKLMSLESLKAH